MLYIMHTRSVSGGCLVYTRGALHSRYTLEYPGFNSTKLTSFILKQNFEEIFLFDLSLDELCFPVIISIPTEASYSFACSFSLSSRQSKTISLTKSSPISSSIDFVT
jgi:hypothetical protein